MLTREFNTFRHGVRDGLHDLRGEAITKRAFDRFCKTLLAQTAHDDPEWIYSRDGMAFVNPLDRDTFQIVALQINTFGPRVFGPSIVKFCTPLLVTVSTDEDQRQALRTLKDTPTSIDAFYLGRHFSGSKGKLCNRETFSACAQELFMGSPGRRSFNHHTVYQLMSANYICHHIAETMGYAFGALSMHWDRRPTPLFMSSGCKFNAAGDSLTIEIIDTFSREKMRNNFVVPSYAKLGRDAERFRERYDALVWEATYGGDLDIFQLPVGYQKVAAKRRGQRPHVVTTQYILQHILRSYFKRQNAFVVSSTFQTLEYLARAMLARTQGRMEESAEFMQTVTSCMGYFPERDFAKLWREKKAAFPDFEEEFSETMFFRPPVLT